jgi:hypothetical protein
MLERTFFLSDLHMGIGARENLYQGRYHERAVKAILRHMTERADETRDFVILGDWFDMLATPPEKAPYALAAVIEANHGLFEPQADKSGDFPSLIGALCGRASYVNGNHDQFVGLGELNAALSLPAGRGLRGDPDPVRNARFAKGGIVAEHGHMHSLLFRAKAHAQPGDPPFGIFITRALAQICDRELDKAGKACAPELKGGGEPGFGFGDALFAGKELLELALRAEDLAEAVIDMICELAGTKREFISFRLDGGSVIAGRDIPARYRDLWSSVAEDLEPLLVDARNSLDKSAEAIAEREGARIVVMGHTHRPLLRAQRLPRETVYANSGYCCPDLVNRASGERFPTFVEIEHRPGLDRVMLRKIDSAGSVATLSSADIPNDQ